MRESSLHATRNKVLGNLEPFSQELLRFEGSANDAGSTKAEVVSDGAISKQFRKIASL